ncbi:MAG: site-specific DNA-methyltransferase [Nitrospirota bacterium]|nr:site-specific DNA-methyltransferase [Nitrospirota bacterium]
MSRLLAYDPKHALNAICPYYTMFPLEYPFRILRKHCKDSPVVFDPFCGRGTTIYAARYLGLPSWGTDTSPIAVAIAKAKLAASSLEDVLDLAATLIGRKTKQIPRTEFFRRAYSKKTLSKMCALREGLLKVKEETNESVLLRAAALGCLHGPLTKSVQGAGYFSNQMPRTFASKPDYSVQYWKKNNLSPPDVDILEVLRRKLSRIEDLKTMPKGASGHVLCADARKLPLRRDLQKQTSLVITSPPYYGMRTYVQDQWLRMWFLGGPATVDYQGGDQLDHNGQDNFIHELAKVWKRIGQSQAERVDLYVRFGCVPSKKSDAKKILQSSLDQAEGWKLISVRHAHSSHKGRRQADQMGRDSKADAEYDFHAVRD